MECRVQLPCGQGSPGDADALVAAQTWPAAPSGLSRQTWSLKGQPAGRREERLAHAATDRAPVTFS